MAVTPRFMVKPAEQFSGSEANDAKHYWSTLPVPNFYKETQTHWSEFVAEQILKCNPKSVLEFGCNAGRNLLALQQRAPGLELRGIDINADAVTFGRRERGLELSHADETFFQKQADAAFDVIFTVSVLDHLPSPKPVLTEMVRVARVAVLLLEPCLGQEGKVVKNLANETEATPYSYSWNYQHLVADLPVRFSQEPYPLAGTQLGPYYWLIRLVK